MGKTILVSAATVVLTVLALIGVAWATDIFTIDRDGTVRLKVTDTQTILSGKVGINNSTPITDLHVTDASGNCQIVVDGLAGYVRDVVFQSSGVARWILRTDGSAESGSNSGSIFYVSRRADDGNPIDTPFAISRATGNVGIGTTSPATSAKLDIVSTNGAILIPRMTTTQRDALTAANGMIVYNTTTNAFNFYENGAWGTK